MPYEKDLEAFKAKLEEANATVTALDTRISNKAAGARLRKISLELGKLGKDLRKSSVEFYK